MKQRYNDLSEELCRQAVHDCFRNKWGRDDVLTFIEKYAGIRRQEFWEMELKDPGNIALKLEAEDAIGSMLFETVADIENGIYPEDMEPVVIRQRPDGMTGKIRDIALLCIIHQLLGHVAKLMLDPLLRARLEPTQHASIPGRGQTLLKKQTGKFLRRHPEVKYADKTDIKSAYKSMKYRKIIKIIKGEIPSAHTLIALLNYLATLAPGGHLIIGGYLDAWLFNFAMSYAIRGMKNVGSTRRGKFIPALKNCITYMDDFAIYSTSVKGIKMLLKALSKFVSESLDVTLKVTTGILHILDISEEHKRHAETKPSKRGCPCIDMAGYKICRSHVTIRRRVFRKARRQFIRAWREYKATGTLRLFRAQRVVSYNSYIKQTDSWKAEKNYHVKELMKVAKCITSHHSRQMAQERKERLLHALHIGIDTETCTGYSGNFAGRLEAGDPYRECGRSIDKGTDAGWWNHIVSAVPV